MRGDAQRLSTVLSALRRLASTLKARKGSKVKAKKLWRQVNWIIGQARQL